MRIRDIFERVTRKAVIAHLIRHMRGTELSSKYGIGKAADALGIGVGLCKQFYDHSELTEDEFLESLE